MHQFGRFSVSNGHVNHGADVAFLPAFRVELAQVLDNGFLVLPAQSTPALSVLEMAYVNQDLHRFQQRDPVDRIRFYHSANQSPEQCSDRIIFYNDKRHGGSDMSDQQ